AVKTFCHLRPHAAALLRPVSRSVITLTDSTWPACANISRKFSSVAENGRFRTYSLLPIVSFVHSIRSCRALSAALALCAASPKFPLHDDVSGSHLSGKYFLHIFSNVERIKLRLGSKSPKGIRGS